MLADTCGDFTKVHTSYLSQLLLSVMFGFFYFIGFSMLSSNILHLLIIVKVSFCRITFSYYIDFSANIQCLISDFCSGIIIAVPVVGRPEAKIIISHHCFRYRDKTYFHPTFMILLIPVHFENDSRMYFLIVLLTDTAGAPGRVV